MPTETPTPRFASIHFANRPCWQLSAPQGTAMVAQHGGQVLSWTPQGGTEVLWLSALAQDPPAATRGGIPVCWPWFGKQGMPEGAMQHGPVRNRTWQVVQPPTVTAQCTQVTLQPTPAEGADDPLSRYAAWLDLRLRITLDDALTLELTTRNTGITPLVLTQALHTYLAVGDVRRVSIAELADLPYHDKLTHLTGQTHATPWRFEAPCDRIYLPPRSPDRTSSSDRHYTVSDALGQRRIHLHTRGSRSVVLWNPGAEGACTMADVPPHGWTQFLCLEAANADTDLIRLAPGGSHTLRQRLTVTPWEGAP